jgi:hypothetical protein
MGGTALTDGRARSIGGALEADESAVLRRVNGPLGPIGHLADKYTPEAANLLGFVLDLSYDEATFITCDAWKRACGGVPRNSFVVVRLNPRVGRSWAGPTAKPSLILARVVEAVATPVSAEMQQTVFAIHKVQAVLDPFTDQELQWGALKAAILGTYYDGEDGVTFGNDLDSYMSSHYYEVYVPDADDLELLVNSFVAALHPETIGHLRYTETATISRGRPVPIKVSPADFVANRTALFGKTRMGKSNTVKIVCDMLLRTMLPIGQVIFDLNAEYGRLNEQDKTSIFHLHPERCERYSLNPRTPEDEKPVKPLRVNFHSQVELGHAIINALWPSEHANRPNYVIPLLEWEPCDVDDVGRKKLEARFPDIGEKTRYLRALSMYHAALLKANFAAPDRMWIDLHVTKDIRAAIAEEEVVAGVHAAMANLGQNPARNGEDLPDRIPLAAAEPVYRQLWQLWKADPESKLFKTGAKSGRAYFDDIHVSLLRMIADRDVSGSLYLMPFARFHHPTGGRVTADIVKLVDEGKTVIVDLSNSDEVVARYYSELIAQAIFAHQTEKFAAGTLGEHSVLFYFEEAHNLFRSDDKDLRSIYNRLAKEGAKYRIGLVYSTQSMTTLSPDLLKNTENLIIAHLNDDREIHELTRRYEFKDVGLDIQRSKTKGYVRMITLSHRYALPVQIAKFGPRTATAPPAGAPTGA